MVLSRHSCIVHTIHTQQRSFVAAQEHRHMKSTTVVAQTSKGHRIFLEGIGWRGYRYNVHYGDSKIIITMDVDGKRKVVNSKGGVIDLEGKRISTWKRDATSVNITYHSDTIVIERN